MATWKEVEGRNRGIDAGIPKHAAEQVERSARLDASIQKAQAARRNELARQPVVNPSASPNQLTSERGLKKAETVQDVLGHKPGRKDSQITVESPSVTSPSKSSKDSPLEAFKWQPGESGNLAGRPKTSDLKAEVRAFADEADPKVRKTRLRVWLEMADRRARQGSPKHLEMLLSYGWGRPSQALELDANISYTDALNRMKARRQLEEHRAGLPAATPTNGHSDAQTAQAAALLPDQDVSNAREDDFEPAGEGRPAGTPRPAMKVRVEL